MSSSRSIQLDARGADDISVTDCSSTVAPPASGLLDEHRSPHSGLRIRIPSGIPPKSPVEGRFGVPPTAPQTATKRQQHSAYRDPHATPLPENPMFDPNTAAAIHQFTTQKSAVALLTADVSARWLRESVRSNMRPRLSTASPASHHPTVSPAAETLVPAPVTHAAAASNAVIPSAESSDPLPRTQATVLARVTSLTHLIHKRLKPKASSTKVTNVPADSSCPVKSSEPPLNPTAPRPCGAWTPTELSMSVSASPDMAGDSVHRQGNGVRTVHADEPTATSTTTAATAGLGAGEKDMPLPQPSSDSQDQDSEEPQQGSTSIDLSSVGSANDDIGMDRVLEEAAKVKGLRLTWLLYVMIILVIILFVLIFLLISFSTDRTIEKSGTRMLHCLTVSTTNNAELLRHDVLDFFFSVNNTFNAIIDDIPSALVTRELLCARLYSAPIAISYYNNLLDLEWSFECDPAVVDLADIPRKLPDSVIASGGTARLVRHSDYALAAYYSDINRRRSKAMLAVFLKKDVIGRFLFSNSQPAYSTATLQSVNLGVLLPTWTTLEPRVALTTLTLDSPNYSVEQPTRLGYSLQSVFDNICGRGKSEYVWHSVVHEGNTESGSDSQVTLREPSRISTEHSLPTPYKEGGGTWGIVSRMALCSALCSSDTSEYCFSTNPSAIWFTLENMVTELKQDSSLNIVGAISIIAVILFTIILMLAYIGISLPVHFLRYQLLSTVGSKRRLSGCRRCAYRWTRRFWISDLISLIRAIHVLSLCFRLNKKYVPEHVLRNHAKQLYEAKGGLVMLEAHIDEVASNASEDDDVDDKGSHGPRDGYDNQLEDIHDFVATTALQRESSTQLGLSMTTTQVPSGGLLSIPGIRREESDVYGHTGSLMDVSEQRSHSATSPSPPRKCSAAVRDRDRDGNGMSGFAEEGLGIRQGSLANQDFLLNTASFDVAEGIGVPVALTDTLYARPTMSVRRTEEATILCVRILEVDRAYLLDYRVALKQHRRIMRFLLNRMRHYRGAIFYRCGECLAAVWNAFDSCYNHAEHAAACAQNIASAFAPYREQGMQVGIVLHQGTFVCGTVEDTREAFVTAFGDGPRQAMHLAELAAAQPAFSILITEPVKQALSAKYECFIVDVIHFQDMVHYLILFELGLPRAAAIPRRTETASVPLSPHSSIASGVVVQYAKVFALFRSHEFKAALDGIQTIRQTCMCTESVERLLARLEQLSAYYRATDRVLPMPYSRAYPTWPNYELVAAVEGVPMRVCSPVSDRAEEVGAFESAISLRTTSPTSTLAPATRAWGLSSDERGGAVGAGAPTGSPGSGTGGGGGGPFALPEVLYDKMLRVFDEEISFKRELHDNIKRLGTPAQRSPHMRPGKETLLEVTTSPTSSTGSSGHTPSFEGSDHRHRPSAQSLDRLPPLPVLPASMANMPAPTAAEAAEANSVTGTSTAVFNAGDALNRSATSNAAESDGSQACGPPLTVRHGPHVPSSASLQLPPPPLAGLGPRPLVSSYSTSADMQQAVATGNTEDPATALALPVVIVDNVKGAAAGASTAMREATAQASDTSTEAHHSEDAEPQGVPQVPSMTRTEPLPAEVVGNTEENNRAVDTAAGAAGALAQLRSAAAVEAGRRLQAPGGGLPPSVHSEDIPIVSRGYSFHLSSDPRSASFAAHHQPGSAGIFGSFVSLPSEGEPNSVIQSAGVSLADADGQFHSMSLCRTELPMQIVGKNGTTYMRSARILGRGSFGSVYLGMDIHSGKLVAIKFLPMPSEESEIDAVEAEVSIMQRVKDSHVVEFITYAFERTSIILVIECMMAGSLQNMISAFKVLPSTTAHVFMRDVLRGLNKLHSMGIIHRDVKPQNVLLTLAGNCKISDFGASAWLHELARKEAQGQVLGTPVYLAPEAARGKPVETSDIWSCGIMFLQLITGRLPYPQEQLELPAPILVYQIGLGGAVPVIPDNLDELDASFVRACLQTNPQDRKTATQLLQMPLFTL